VSDRIASTSPPSLAPTKGVAPPTAARNRLLLEGPILPTLLRLAAPNVLNLRNAVRGTGNMSLPAAVLVGCVLAYIAISPVLIFGLGPVPALGPAGAGWGLAIPFGVCSVVMTAGSVSMRRCSSAPSLV